MVRVFLMRLRLFMMVLIMPNFIEQYIGRRQVYICLPPMYSQEIEYPTVYIHSDIKTQEILKEIFSYYHFSFIGIMIISEDRQSDYTPWPADALDRRHASFKGQGKKYLDWLLYSLKPSIEKEYKIMAGNMQTALIGRSLSALFNLYAFCQIDCFGRIACISPSVWYEKFTDYFCTTLPFKNGSVFITMGSNEGANKQNSQKYITSNVEQCFCSIDEKISGDNSIFFDDGGHHDFVKERYLLCFNTLNQHFNRINKS